VWSRCECGSNAVSLLIYACVNLIVCAVFVSCTDLINKQQKKKNNNHYTIFRRMSEKGVEIEIKYKDTKNNLFALRFRCWGGV